VNCPKCGDKVDMNAGHVCLTGNDRLKERITYLQARIAELEKLAVVWHKYPDEKPDNRIPRPAGGEMTALLILFAAICVLAVLAQRAIKDREDE